MSGSAAVVLDASLRQKNKREQIFSPVSPTNPPPPSAQNRCCAILLTPPKTGEKTVIGEKT